MAATQYAGGWAVNGGAADWFEQVLPIRNNGINYTIKSGYMDWTTSLGSGDGQHALIQSLNAQWLLQNLFSWWFSGPFTGARHVYGWAPSAGYSGGHADMPVYPHAGGLGMVGIGSDAAGTNTDNPGSGALIFGHELMHDYNVYHTNTADACGSNDSNSDFPYANSSIQEVGYNPITGKIYDPGLDPRPDELLPLGRLQTGLDLTLHLDQDVRQFRASGGNPVTSLSRSRSVVGRSKPHSSTRLYNPPSGGNFGPLYKTQGVLPTTLTPGAYSVQLRGAGAGCPGELSIRREFPQRIQRRSPRTR